MRSASRPARACVATLRGAQSARSAQFRFLEGPAGLHHSVAARSATASRFVSTSAARSPGTSPSARWPRYLLWGAALSPAIALAYVRPPGGALGGLDRDPQRQTIFTDFSDTAKVYRPVSSWGLFETLLMYRFCSHEFLVDRAAEIVHALPTISNFLLEKTVYGHFIAGRDTEEALNIIRRKYAPTGVSTALFFSIENANTPDEWDAVETKVRSIMDSAASANSQSEAQSSVVTFIPIKLTALTDDATLLHVAAWMRFQRRFPNHPSVKEALGKLHPSAVGYALPPSYAEESADALGERPPAPLTNDQIQLLNATIERVVKLSEYARERGLRVLIDAEQTYLQPAIDLMALRVMQETNRKTENPADGVSVYNTYQCYLTYTEEKFDSHLQLARDGGWVLGAKVVRGAYLESERELARANNLPNPIHPNKATTDHAYNTVIAKVLESAAGDGAVAGFMGTHNLESVVLAAQRHRALGLRPDDKRMYYAQLMGMGSNLTLALADMGFNSNKLVPYGPVDVVMPYLLRRLQENKDLLSGAQYERQLLYTELKRRAGPFGVFFI